MGSFNFGSFRGDPRKRVRQEVSNVVSSPSVIKDLESEFLAFLEVATLAP